VSLGFLARVFKARKPPLERDVRAAYALWAESYPPHAHTPLMKLEEEAMLGLLPDCSGLRVLDLGSGSGRYLRLLRPRGPRLAVGLDLSFAMLARATGGQAPVAQGDGLALPFADRSFDLVASGLMVGHVADLRHLLREAARVTRPGGVVVYSDLHPEGARAGWVRTFRTPDGTEYAAPHHVHTRADHERACQAAELEVEAVVEPLVDFAHPWQGRPAAIVVRARRSARAGERLER
jgi:malonyl-CoA O-methyltransferase